MATTPTKTQGTSVLAWQDVATGSVVLSSAVDVTTKWAAAFSVQIGRRSGTAFTAGWPVIRIQGSGKSSGNDKWVDLWSYTPQVGSSIANTTLNGNVSAGATTFVVTAATNIAVGDVLFLKGDTDAGNELVKVKGVSSTTITPWEAVTNAHASGDAVTDQAEEIFPALDLSAYGRVRAVIDNASGGVTVAAEVLMTSFDSF